MRDYLTERFVVGALFTGSRKKHPAANSGETECQIQPLEAHFPAIDIAIALECWIFLFSGWYG